IDVFNTEDISAECFQSFALQGPCRHAAVRESGVGGGLATSWGLGSERMDAVAESAGVAGDGHFGTGITAC
ncbi:hypothetical protein, partial [Collinsella sp. AF02-46-1]|uniref:hypothetical protein n=1 Tax=Collinsella sp. AF02-46-1 TaxID=2292207 RepID=UPI001F2B1AEC